MASESTILVVDDDPLGLEVACTTLRHLEPSWDILGFDDPHNALEIAWGLPHCVVVTDWNMPGMQGIDLLKAIRLDDKLKHLPVLMVTAEAKREQIIEAAQAGVNGYIVKPFTAATLKEKLDKIFERIG